MQQVSNIHNRYSLIGGIKKIEMEATTKREIRESVV